MKREGYLDQNEHEAFHGEEVVGLLGVSESESEETGCRSQSCCLLS